MDLLRKTEAEIRKCVKCGVCRAHCPVFQAIGREPAAARGKVALAGAVARGDLELDDRTCAEMSKCLLCGSCLMKCPNDVPTDEIVLAAREAIAKERGLSCFHLAVRVLLKNRLLMTTGAFLAALFRPFIFRKVPHESGLRLRFPISFAAAARRHFPRINPKPFTGMHPEIIEGEAGKPSVLYFVGCMTNYIYPEIGESAVTLLQRLGCTVIIPKEQGCCGYPAVSGGDSATFAFLAERNLSVMEKYSADYVMTACASCGSALQELYPSLLDKIRPDLAERSRLLGEKLIDASMLLKNLGFTPPNTIATEKTVLTYHDPCHLRRRKVVSEPRELIASLNWAEMVEMENASSCCGLGGTFGAYHYELSMAINRKKVDSIRNSSAEIVVTGCPGCMFQISDGLQHHRADVKVRHILEMLAEKQ